MIRVHPLYGVLNFEILISKISIFENNIALSQREFLLQFIRMRSEVTIPFTSWRSQVISDWNDHLQRLDAGFQMGANIYKPGNCRKIHRIRGGARGGRFEDRSRSGYMNRTINFKWKYDGNRAWKNSNKCVYSEVKCLQSNLLGREDIPFWCLPLKNLLPIFFYFC